jgi:hypothetical protein
MSTLWSDPLGLPPPHHPQSATQRPLLYPALFALGVQQTTCNPMTPSLPSPVCADCVPDNLQPNVPFSTQPCLRWVCSRQPAT